MILGVMVALAFRMFRWVLIRRRMNLKVTGWRKILFGSMNRVSEWKPV